MTDNEQLERIKARCRANIALAEALKKKWACQSDYVKDMCQSIAGWRSTIAAIDELQDLADWGASCADFSAKALARIIAAWPEELL